MNRNIFEEYMWVSFSHAADHAAPDRTASGEQIHGSKFCYSFARNFLLDSFSGNWVNLGQRESCLTGSRIKGGQAPLAVEKNILRL